MFFFVQGTHLYWATPLEEVPPRPWRQLECPQETTALPWQSQQRCALKCICKHSMSELLKQNAHAWLSKIWRCANMYIYICINTYVNLNLIIIYIDRYTCSLYVYIRYVIYICHIYIYIYIYIYITYMVKKKKGLSLRKRECISYVLYRLRYSPSMPTGSETCPAIQPCVHISGNRHSTKV